MKNQLPALTAFALCLSLAVAFAQPGPMRGGGMGGPPPGPDFSGPLAKLFGGNSSFSAAMEMQVKDASGTGNPVTSAGKIAVSDGKSRFEVDMIKSAGSRMTEQHAASLKAMGFDTVVMISRPDLKVSYMVYPGLNAYVENPASDSAATAGSQAKVETTELGKETVDGHRCVKNKVVVTDDKGNSHESTVWCATDLKNFPVKIDQTENGSETSITFTDIKFDKVGSDQFEAPAGASKYSDIGSMMHQEIMKRAMRNRGGQ